MLVVSLIIRATRPDFFVVRLQHTPRGALLVPHFSISWQLLNVIGFTSKSARAAAADPKQSTDQCAACRSRAVTEIAIWKQVGLSTGAIPRGWFGWTVANFLAVGWWPSWLVVSRPA